MLLLALALTGVMAQQPETLSLLEQPLYPSAVPGADRRELERAVSDGRAAVAKEPANIEPVLRLASAQWDLGLVRDSIETLTRALERNLDSPALRVLRGRGFIALRKFPLAEREFGKAGDVPEAHCGRGAALYLLEQYPAARKEFAGCPNGELWRYLSARRAGDRDLARPSAPADARPSAADITLPGSVARKKTGAQSSIAGAYMDAVDRLLAGDTAGAKKLLEPLVEKHKADWTDPIYVAAEADYARIVKAEPKKKKKKK